MRFLRSNTHWGFFFVFLVFGSVFFYYLNKNISKTEQEKQFVRLENQHARTLDKFESSVDKFAGLVAGMRSYINLSPKLPNAYEFQQFVKNQFNDVKSKDSIVVSFIDTSHVFKQSFTRTEMNPAYLVGVSVSSLRSQQEIKMLNQMMKQDSLHVFPPINLLEGWVGLPINFRVRRNDTILGYVAAIINFKSFTDAIYSDAASKDFIFHFATQEDFDIDSEQVYNNTKVYNTKKDSTYYKNFVTDKTNFVYSNVKYYGFEFKVGTSFKSQGMLKGGFSLRLVFWYLIFVLLAAIVTWQIGVYRSLNLKLAYANSALLVQKKELKKITKTQNKFFSIIGHDIKQPLNAIEGLIYLLKDEKIEDSGLMTIIQNLKESTRSTINLLNNLLRWALSQTGDIQFKEVPIEIHKSIKEAAVYLKQQAQEKEIVIIKELNGEILYHGDCDMIDTIIRNLLSNAIKFSHEGGKIIVKTEMKDNTLHISVKDYGIGISSEVLETLFVLDDQMNTLGTNGEQGTGLGLVLCNDFVKQHKGNIEVDSVLGQGTIFTVILPCEDRDHCLDKFAPPVFMKTNGIIK